MDRYCTYANLGELARESLGAVLGPTKHDGRAVRECDSSSEVRPSGAIHAPEVVRPSAHRVSWCVEYMTTRIVLVLLDQAVNVALQRGRKQQRLVLRADLSEDRANDWHEAHVGHAICFVDDDCLDVAESDGSLFEQVEESSWAGDRDVDATLERLELLTKADAAVEGGNPHVSCPTDQAELFGDLGREFTGWRKDERLRAAWSRRVRPNHQGNAEGEGFS
jgi:hypothetical protein